MERERKRTIFALMILVIVYGCFSFAFSGSSRIILKDNWLMKSSHIVNISGQRISSPSFRPEHWHPTEIPTTVLSALVKNGLYPDPYIGLNNMKIPDASAEFTRKYDLGKFSLYDDALRRRYGEPENLADYLLKGQLVNAENFRAIFEAVNHVMHKVSGVLLWKINPAWPSVAWQLYDWYLRPHAGYYFVKKACEPLHIQLNIDDYSVSVINQTREAHRGLFAAVNIYSLKMEKILSQNAVIDIPSGSSKEVFVITIPKKYLNDIHFIDLCLLDKKGNLLSGNFYWLSAKRDFTLLTDLPDVKLDVSIKRYIKGTSSLIKIRLTNPSPGLAGNEAYLKLAGWNIVPQTIKINFF